MERFLSDKIFYSGIALLNKEFVWALDFELVLLEISSKYRQNSNNLMAIMGQLIKVTKWNTLLVKIN